MNDYLGKEIITPLRRRNNKIVVSQKVVIRCSKCKKKHTTTYYNHLSNIKTHLNNPKYVYMCIHCIDREYVKKLNQFRKGKTYDQIYGNRKAKVIKKQLQKFAKNHPSIKFRNGSVLFRKGMVDYKKGKTYEQLYGVEKAKIRKLQCAHYGSDNAQFGKPSYQGSGNGWSGWYRGWYFRSIRELSFMINYIERNKLKWKTAESKQYAIPYQYYNGSIRNYFADFILEERDVIEVKLKTLINTPLVLLKKDAAQKWCKDRGFTYTIINDEEFDILTIQDLKRLHDEKEIKWLPKYEDKFKEII